MSASGIAMTLLVPEGPPGWVLAGVGGVPAMAGGAVLVEGGGWYAYHGAKDVWDAANAYAAGCR